MHEVIHPENWAPTKGYANGIAAQGRMLFVGGQIGWNEDQVFEAHDFVGQTEQALKNIVAVVSAAGGAPADLVRLTWFVTDKAEYLAKQKEIGAVYRAVIGRTFPAMTLVVVSSLLEEAALVEIEATAVLPAQT